MDKRDVTDPQPDNPGQDAADSPGSSTTTTTIPFPMWQYPEMAERIPRSGQPDVPSSPETLRILLEHPVNLNYAGEMLTILPAQAAADLGQSHSEFLDVIASLHRDGLLTWDESSHTHRTSF